MFLCVLLQFSIWCFHWSCIRAGEFGAFTTHPVWAFAAALLMQQCEFFTDSRLCQINSMLQQQVHSGRWQANGAGVDGDVSSLTLCTSGRDYKPLLLLYLILNYNNQYAMNTYIQQLHTFKIQFSITHTARLYNDIIN